MNANCGLIFIPGAFTIVANKTNSVRWAKHLHAANRLCFNQRRVVFLFFFSFISIFSRTFYLHKKLIRSSVQKHYFASLRQMSSFWATHWRKVIKNQKNILIKNLKADWAFLRDFFPRLSSECFWKSRK